MTGNASEWTRTLAMNYVTNGNSYSEYSIADYPQQEDLNSPRHQYWSSYWAIKGYTQDSRAQFVYKFGAPIYDRTYGLSSIYTDGYSNYGDNYMLIGFRVIRRYIPDDSAD
jgi:hypothetical protein